jgi:hypothetical protein
MTNDDARREIQGYAPAIRTTRHLFVVNPNGTGFHQITSDTLDDSDPRWFTRWDQDRIHPPFREERLSERRRDER